MWAIAGGGELQDSEENFQVVLLSGKPWATDGDVDRQQEATERINHSIIGVPESSFQTKFTWPHDIDFDIC